jgi:methionyl-tRNA formyltransferase
MDAGAELVIKTLRKIIAGKIDVIPQETLVADQAALKQAPKIFKEDCRIDWNQNVGKIHDFIRGLSPHPTAFTELLLPDGEMAILKIFRAVPEEGETSGRPGDFISDGKSSLKVVAKNGYLRIIELQLAGRKAMNSGDFLRGFGRFFPETHGI